MECFCRVFIQRQHFSGMTRIQGSQELLFFGHTELFNDVHA